MATPGTAVPGTAAAPATAAAGAAAAPDRTPASALDVSPAAAPVRLLAGFAGFGAGSVNLAISSSMFAAPGAMGPARLLAGVLAGLWGAALLAGAVVFLGRERPAGHWTRYALSGAAVVHLAAIAFGASGLSLTQLSALLLTLMAIASIGWLRRSGERRQHKGTAPQPVGMRPGRLLLAAFAGAVLVAAIATPGLAASIAGQYAVPHGGHGTPAPGGHHQR
ncbi:hypothetical protein AB0284_18225 [Pseudarthrobacter phenanthrenivorans]|uniref:hypothetical protein n=1 Tax=Pseudarthrobacter phenanthrenivorans TaxID=361575 RepID=UPI00344B6658